MPEQATVQARTAEPGDALTKAAPHVIQRRQRSFSELDDNGLLGRRKHGAFGLPGAHGRISGRGAGAPLRDRGEA